MSLLIPDWPAELPRKKKRHARRGRSLPPAGQSCRFYVYIKPSQVYLFRFLLEAQDNLGLMTVVDRWRAALLLRCSPHQEREFRDFLDGMRQTVPFEGPFTLPR